MKKPHLILLWGICLVIGSCICPAPIYVDFVNKTSTPVILTYSTRNMNITDSIYYDTISYKIDSDSILKLHFKATYNNSREKLSKCILFFKFETPTETACFESQNEVKKIFNKNGECANSCKFIISDSLFSNKK